MMVYDQEYILKSHFKWSDTKPSLLITKKGTVNVAVL